MTKELKISKKELNEKLNVLIKQKLLESNSFSAMRSIQHMATSTSMEFEKNILDALNLLEPDHMQDDLQAKYYNIVMTMKNKIANATMDAAKQLLSFPKEDEQSSSSSLHEMKTSPSQGPKDMSTISINRAQLKEIIRESLKKKLGLQPKSEPANPVASVDPSAGATVDQLKETTIKGKK